MRPSSSVDPYGIQQDWVGADDRPRRASDDTVRRLREVIGQPPADLEETAPLVVRPGARLGAGQFTVHCEDGTTTQVADVLPNDFPLGYHRLADAAGRERALIVSPGRCALPESQVWGWTVQLYAARGDTSWGIGDLGDLRELREWTVRTGGGFLLVNPLHAVAPTLPQEASPYLPATRRFRNPLYLRVEDVPGFRADDLDEEAADLKELRSAPLVDRDPAWRLKRTVLRRIFDRTAGTGEAGFETWRAAVGRTVEQWGVWCVLADEHGPDWRQWPEPLRRPDASEVAELAAARADDVSFHVWLQWLLDEQLRAATGELTVLQDLPIGVAGGGADAWTWQESLAAGVTVGAPPDLLNTSGQDWGSPPLVPWRLRAADYVPFIESVRATIAGAGGLRIDHVMGLFRLWWIPQGASATEGAYVRYPADDLLDIVALESHRAGAVVVGEDLGTVEPGVREALEERGILSYRVLWFEDEPPAEWPVGALAAVTTHDLPTVAGLWTGSDVDDQLEASDMAEADVRAGREALLERLGRDGLARSASVSEAVAEAHRQLADAPCLLLSVALEDAVAEERRPNVPGTVDRENWRIPLRRPVEDLVASAPPAAAAVVADAVAQRGAGRGTGRGQEPTTRPR